MVAAAAASAIFLAASSSHESGGGAKKSTKLGGENVGVKSISTAGLGGMRVRANAHAPPKMKGTNSVGVMADSFRNEGDTAPPPARRFINQLPDWSMLLAAITTIFLAAEKQWMMLDWKPRRPDMISGPFGLGKIVQDGFVFRQNFSIRSYEIGADRSASIETVMNHLQDSALNHFLSSGLSGDGFGSTPEMCKKNLIWVIARIQILFDRYPTWGDVVEVDTWVSAFGRNGMRRDWIFRDTNTGETLTRACSVCVLMNKITRKISKLPDEVRDEIQPHFVDAGPVLEDDGRKLPKLDGSTADYVRTGLTPRWSDLDVNQHVNNVKYITWILESAPQKILESHELSSLTLEYRRECGKDAVLQSLTTVSGDGTENMLNSGMVDCQHLLRLESGAEVVKGRSMWRPKPAGNNFKCLGQIPAEGA